MVMSCHVMYACIYLRMDGWIYAWMHGCMDVWMYCCCVAGGSIGACIDKIDKLDWIDVAQDRIGLDKSRYG